MVYRNEGTEREGNILFPRSKEKAELVFAADDRTDSKALQGNSELVELLG